MGGGRFREKRARFIKFLILLYLMEAKTEETVTVNIAEIVDSIARAGKLYGEHGHEIDAQGIMVKESGLAGVYLDAADVAKARLDQGELLDVVGYDRTHFDIGYEALKRGKIKVWLMPGSE